MIDSIEGLILAMSWFVTGFIGFQIGKFVSKQEGVKDDK